MKKTISIILACAISLVSCRANDTGIIETPEDIRPPDERYGNTAGNISNGARIAQSEGWIYLFMDTGLYKMRPDKSEKTRIELPKFEGVTRADATLNVVDGWIYYSDFNHGIFRFRTDGTDLENISEFSAGSMCVYDGWIYFSKRETDPNPSGGNFYTLYKIRTNGRDLTEIIGSPIKTTINVADEWIYYVMSGSIRRIKIDGTQGGAVYDSSESIGITVSDYFVVYSDYIFFSINGHENLYRINTDGSDLRRLVETRCTAINVWNDYVFYVSDNSGKSWSLSQIHIDGGTPVSIFTNEESFTRLNTAFDTLYFTIWKDWKLYSATHGVSGMVLVDETEFPHSSTILTPNLSTANGWSHSHINEAFTKGFIPAGLLNNYTNVITRAEFVRLAMSWLRYKTGLTNWDLLKAHGIPGYADISFTDTDDWDVIAAAGLGITAGTGDGKFSPDGGFTREQAATMIMNTCKVIGADVNDPPAFGFADISSASSWAIPGINFVGTNGIMSGTGNNNFSPQVAYTREQSIVTFNNIKLGTLM
jgi:hypothetical protein